MTNVSNVSRGFGSMDAARSVSIAASCALACFTAFATASDTNWEALRETLKQRHRPLILNSDGNEMVYYPTNAPVSLEGFAAQRLSSYARSRVSSLSYCPWSSGFGLMTTTRAGEFFDRPIDLQEGCTNAAPLFAAIGCDCLDMSGDFCRTNGMEIFVSLRMNDTHDVRYPRPGTNPSRSWLFPNWKADHPDCLFSTDANKPPYGSWTAVDYENGQVREYLKQIVSDCVTNYDVDGIEYDFMRHGPILKTVGWGASATDGQLQMMTDLMQELREITEAAGRRKGKPVLVLVRTADSVDYAKGLGVDIEEWMRRGLLDIWSVSDYFQLEYLKGNADLAHRYGVRFYSALAESRVMNSVKTLQSEGKDVRALTGRNTLACFAAEYQTAKWAGCDGVESFNMSVLGKPARERMLRIDPENVSTMDKVYFAQVRGVGGIVPEDWLKDGDGFYRRPQINPVHPLVLQAGETCSFQLEIGDAPEAGGKVVAKAAFEGAGPVLSGLVVNGNNVPLSSYAEGVHVFELSPSDWKQGVNAFAVTPAVSDGGTAAFADFALYVDYLSSVDEIADKSVSVAGGGKAELTAAYRFDLWSGMDCPESAALQQMAALWGDVINWNAEYVVMPSRAVKAGSVDLYVQTASQDEPWTRLSLPCDLEPGEPFCLLTQGLGETPMTYLDMVERMGRFSCGAKNLSADNGRTELVFALRLTSPDLSKTNWLSVASSRLPKRYAGNWFDAQVSLYTHWPEDAALAAGGSWSAGTARLEDVAAVRTPGTLEVAADTPVSFAANEKKSPSGGTGKVVIESEVDFDVYDADALPPVDPSWKGGVLLATENGELSYFGLVRSGEKNVWMKLKAAGDASVQAEGSSRLRIVLSGADGSRRISYNINGVDYSGSGSTEMEIVASEAMSGVAYGGNGSLHSLLGSVEKSPSGVILVVR